MTVSEINSKSILFISPVSALGGLLFGYDWVVLSEIFPNRDRGVALSVATIALWTACFLLTYIFFLLKRCLMASDTFWPYGIIYVLGFIFIYKKLTQTKGKPLKKLKFELVKNQK